jgi:hypothetical protein
LNGILLDFTHAAIHSANNSEGLVAASISVDYNNNSIRVTAAKKAATTTILTAVTISNILA